MPDSGQPQVPNYVNGVGRLVTDRYDFEDHILGTKFRHNADAIDVLPNLVVGSTTCTNVLQALEALAAAAEPPVIAPATQTMLGVIQLDRDLGGTNGLAPLVIGLQGRSVSPQQPTVGQVLTWNSSAWVPQSITGLFIPGGDINTSSGSPASSASLQYIGNLSGNSGTVGIGANNFTFGVSTTPTISQTPVPSGSGGFFHIFGQGSLSGPGGTLIMGGGGGTPAGSTILALNDVPALTVAQPTSGNSVIAYFSPFFSSTQMPTGTGNGVIYIANASTNPTSGSPSGGAILYGSSGQLWVKQSDSTNFQIGSIPDPSSWTSVAPGSLPVSPTIPANGTITYNIVQTSGTSFPVTCFTFAMPVSSSCRFDTVYVGKEISTGNTAQYNYSIGFVRNGAGSPAAVGTVTSSDSRTVGASWIAPTTTIGSYISGNNIIISTGSSSATSAVWTVVTQVIVTTA